MENNKLNTHEFRHLLYNTVVVKIKAYSKEHAEQVLNSVVSSKENFILILENKTEFQSERATTSVELEIDKIWNEENVAKIAKKIHDEIYGEVFCDESCHDLKSIKNAITKHVNNE